MYIVDIDRFQRALKESGFRSIGELAKDLGIHRNTIHHYLAGNGVFPGNFEKIISALNLRPNDILIEKDEERLMRLEPIAHVIDKLHVKFPEVTFVLFGSRMRGRAHKYSDWDVGVFAADGISHEVYREIVKRKNEIVEDLPFFVDIVNLNRAEDFFLREASKHWMFLSGSVNDWIKLQRKVAT